MKMTHSGAIVPNSSLFHSGWTYRSKLRETKLYWVDRNGVKYCKVTGWPTGVVRPHIILDIDSIVKLT